MRRHCAGRCDHENEVREVRKLGVCYWKHEENSACSICCYCCYCCWRGNCGGNISSAKSERCKRPRTGNGNTRRADDREAEAAQQAVQALGSEVAGHSSPAER